MCSINTNHNTGAEIVLDFCHVLLHPHERENRVTIVSIDASKQAVQQVFLAFFSYCYSLSSLDGGRRCIEVLSACGIVLFLDSRAFIISCRPVI